MTVKLQIRSSKLQRNPKQQNSNIPLLTSLVFDFWNFFGAWILGLGVF